MRHLAILSLLAGVVFMSAPAEAHRVHAGVTEVTLNDRTGELEVMHRVFAHDLQDALSRDDMETADYFASEVGLAEIGARVAAEFRMGSGAGELYALDYVGAEIDGEFAWVYFVMDAPDDLTAFIVDNDILAETFDDQIMMTNIRINSHIRSAIQGPGRRSPVRLNFTTD